MKLYTLLIVLMLQAIHCIAQSPADTTDKPLSGKRDATQSKLTMSNNNEDEAYHIDFTKNSVVVNDVFLDFKTKQLAFPKGYRQLKKGDFLRLKVVNYNPYLYKIILDSKDSVVVAPTDGKLLGWFLDPTNLTSIVANLITSADRAPLGTNSGSDFDKFLKTAPLPHNREELLKESYLLDEALLKSKKPVDTLKVVSDLLKDQTDFINSRQKFIDDVRGKIEEKQYELQRRLALQWQLHPACNAFSKVAEPAFIQELEKQMKQFRADVAAQHQAITGDVSKYYIVTAPYRGFISRNESLKAHDTLITAFYKEVKVALQQLTNAVGYKNTADIVTQLEVMAQSSGCFTSLPIYIKENISETTIEFKPRYDSLALASYKTSFILPTVQTKVWGVSAGVHVTPLRNQGYNNRTVTQTNSNGGVDTLYQLVEDHQGGGQLGINALAYKGWKIKRDNDKENYLGFSFGAGMSVESKPKPRMLVGLSYITGERNRILITIGAIGGNINRLSNAYDTNDKYYAHATGFLKDEFHVNGFLSFNYSFFGK